MTRAFRFWYGFCASLALILILNALSVYRAWFGRDCYDCFGQGGVPYPFMEQGGFVGVLRFFQRPQRDDVIVAIALSVGFGLISIRLLRR